jgi:hypothetical protein
VAVEPLRVLAVAEFDAARVLAGHRKTLRKLGVDYRIFVRDVYPIHDKDNYDWWVDLRGAPRAAPHIDGLWYFAEKADVLQFHPGIGQPWSFRENEVVFVDGSNELVPGERATWNDVNPKAARVSLFHGSRNAAKHAKTYARYWRDRGHAIWATTFDYVTWMEAVYVPPTLHLDPALRAALRSDEDPLLLIQTPTDLKGCHTEEFLRVCRQLGLPATVLHRRPLAEVLLKKTENHAGFDHLRGAFSVNTLENCAIGLVPLVCVQPHYLSGLRIHGKFRAKPYFWGDLDDLFRIHAPEDLQTTIQRLDDSPEWTRIQQLRARAFFENHYSPEVLGPLLLNHYLGLVGSTHNS